MKNNFWGLIWSSFNEIQGVLLGLLGFLGGIALIRYPFNTSIPLDLVIIVSFFTLLLIATLLSAVNTLLRQKQKLEAEVKQLQEVNQKLETEIKQRIIPKILRVQKDANNNIECLLEASDLFAIKSMISLYYTDEDDFERLIGVGSVQSINDKKRIQVVIDEPEITYQNILDKLANNDLKVMQQTRVSPSVIKKYNQP
ncbi:MAG: bZIP transcription factor [Microcystis sp.]|jgi:cell division protein FtsL|uniref:bZIP transcription factor n=1 Tax=Microcystis sp. TaxID=1127 RepID=UPI0022C200C2|nr:bZIP transcription factor [Microcystis sp. LE17-20D]MCZ8064763.1 bZIP transcription factor [Microcystis sp. LE17-20D]MCZ8161188.1 bZIP transcription factor [Microcystis sp. LE19-196.1B]MCZ8275565.1 bZIP transcription factor [Microcystis sp. LE19-4.1E]